MNPYDQYPSTQKRPLLSAKYIPLIALLLLATLLSLLLPDFFRQVILAPVLSRVAILYGIYRGFPQNVVWAVFVFAAFWIMLYAFRTSNSADEKPFVEKPGPSRLNQLATLAADARASQHARWELAREVQQVVIKLMSTAPGETAESLLNRIHSGSLNAPPEVEKLLTLSVTLPNYRSFMDAREVAPHGEIPQLANLDLAATLVALEQWRRANQEQL